MTFYGDNLAPSSSVPFVCAPPAQFSPHLSVLTTEPCPMYQSYSSSSSTLSLPLPPPPPPPSSSINYDRPELCLINVSTPRVSATPSMFSRESVNNDTSIKTTTTTPDKSMRCCSKETLTCIILTSMVIGLPVLIILVLINLPRMTNKRDTRQEHYILLAFGFPFSLVLIVSLVYGIYRLVLRIRMGPDDFKHLRKRMSFRRFSRRLRQQNRQHCVQSSSARAGRTSSMFDVPSTTTSEPEPKLYSLVTKVMFAQHDNDNIHN